MSESILVTSVQVAAAKLKIKRALARGLPVDEATRAIAEARKVDPDRDGESSAGVVDGRAS